ncbi:U1 small nuclear ribonucleoprotein A isoform X1 [Canna indica]|uniref:U1 small nuclear ribonucleoprotein A isoform X1 n=1 Tax=Canna indica TaxID=4628 RepID=A0AAQ3Q3Z9_9LILI|nr:U1 small nuclear ribonucleoprotein A isoform X1 [Canna indica]
MKPSYGSYAPCISSSPPMHPPPPAARGFVFVESSSYSQPYHLQHQYHHHQQPHPAPPPTAPVVYSKPEQQRIKTLFVSGLPDDVKPREIHNLFRRRTGFDFCQLEYTGRGNQVVAFATFFNHQSAIAAISALDGAVFDPETGATLHIELARSNSRKRSRGVGAYMVIDKRIKVTNDDQELSSDDGDGGSDEPSGTDNDNSGSKDALNAVKSGKSTNKPDGADATFNEQPDVPPCSTLFIANLGPTCTEEELKQVLSKYSGFHMLKMRGKGGMPVAFADFTDIESSSIALNELQNTLLESSDRGGMHVEYARSKMRKQ